MVISIYPIDNRAFSFRKQPGVKPVRVRVPRGSELLEVKGLGLELFVPSQTDQLVRGAWNPRAVLAEASREGGRFKLVGRGVTREDMSTCTA